MHRKLKALVRGATTIDSSILRDRDLGQSLTKREGRPLEPVGGRAFMDEGRERRKESANASMSTTITA